MCMEGIIKWYSREKGYGFIKGDDGTDYFFHHTALGKFRPRGEERVTFDTEQGDRGPKAVNVVAEEQSLAASGADTPAMVAAEARAATEAAAGREEEPDEAATKPVAEDEPVAEPLTSPDPSEDPPEKIE